MIKQIASAPYQLEGRDLPPILAPDKAKKVEIDFLVTRDLILTGCCGTNLAVLVTIEIRGHWPFSNMTPARIQRGRANKLANGHKGISRMVRSSPRGTTLEFGWHATNEAETSRYDQFPNLAWFQFLSQTVSSPGYRSSHVSCSFACMRSCRPPSLWH